MYEQPQAGSADEIVAHLPLVRFVVARMMNVGSCGRLEKEDLIGFGVIGLIDAHRRYSPDKGTFASFAVHRIRGAILDALRQNDPLTRGMRRDVRALEEAEGSLRALTGVASARDVEEATGFPETRISAIRAAANVKLVSLEDNSSADFEPHTLAVEVADESESALDRLIHEELIQEVADRVAALPERERIIVTLHFVEGLRMCEIAAVLGISESRVSQLQSRALHRVRKSLAAAA